MLSKHEHFLTFTEEFTLRYITISEKAVTLGLMCRFPFGICPLCNKVSSRVHSYYERKVNDLPISGKIVKLHICVRKFFCDQDFCPRKIFSGAAPLNALALALNATKDDWNVPTSRYKSLVQAVAVNPEQGYVN